MERLHPRVRWLWLGRVAVAAVVFGAVVGAAVRFGLGRSPWPGLAVGLAILVVGTVHAVHRFRVFRYEVQDDALYIERGVLTTVTTVVPYVRVQHVDTQRDPIERLAGLSRVVVYTAGSRGADVAIPGLLPDRARDLQERLRTLANESEPDDAV
ncbi:MAG: PH domain-containing protein [Haloarculaceae archaeon]